MKPEIQKVIEGKCRAPVPFPEDLGAAGAMPRKYSQRTTCHAIQSEVDSESEADEDENALVLVDSENSNPEVSESETESYSSSEVSNLTNQEGTSSTRSSEPSRSKSRSSAPSSSRSPSPIPVMRKISRSRHRESSSSRSPSPIPVMRKKSRSRPREPSSSRSPSPIPVMRKKSRSRPREPSSYRYPSPIPVMRKKSRSRPREPSSSRSPSPIPVMRKKSRSRPREPSSYRYPSPIPAMRKKSRSRPKEPSSSRYPSPIRETLTNFKLRFGMASSSSSSSPAACERLSPGASSESDETSSSAASTSNKAFQFIQKGKRPKTNGCRRPAKRVKISNTQHSSCAPLEEEDDDSEALSFFTIHLLLSAAELEHRFNLDVAANCEDGDDIEFELIQKIMEQINGVYLFERQTYRHQVDAADFSEASDSNFTFAFYSRIINATASYGKIAHGVCEKTGTSDTLDFVYRPGVIFCITTGQGWQDIRRFVDFNFPQKIMCRLTDEASNVETKRFFVGDLAKSVVYKRRPSESDQLTSFSENSTKPARNNSSLYDLSAFQTKNGKKVAGQIGIEFGLTGVRFERKIFPKCIPELLDHLCTIVQGGNTYVFERKTLEKDIKMRLARCISQRDPIAKELNMELSSTIYKFVTNSCTEELLNRFEVCPSQLPKFYNACNFVLCYETKAGEHNQELSGCPPTSLEVFEAMTRIEPLHKAKDMESFQRKIKKLRLSFRVNGKRRERLSLMNMLTGEISLDGRTYWKFANMWLYFSSDYHHLLDTKFLEILNMKTEDTRQDDILFESADEAKLVIPWNVGEKKSDYLEQYKNIQDSTDTICYCLQPPGEDREYLFDMMIVEVKQGHPFLSILYIFDRFNSGLPPASKIINKSLNKITKSTATDHHLEAFYEYQIRVGHGRHGNFFPKLFPKFEDFQRCFHSGVERKVSVVVGFLKEFPDDDEDGAIRYTLRREKTLPRRFGREDGHNILELLEKYPREMRRIQRKLRRARESDPEGIPNDMPGFILRLLQQCGYSLNEDGELSGSLLKIQFGSDFKLFRNDELNEEVFDECIREKFITGFPGFKHKLEVYFIRNEVAHENQFQLRLVDL